METLTREAAKRSLICNANSHECICEKLRTIYDMIHDLPDDHWKSGMIDLLVDAIIMGKKMDDRLLYYQKTYEDATGNEASNLKFIHGSAKIRQNRMARII